MLKRIISLLLSILMVFSMVPAQAFAAETEETVPAETVTETTVPETTVSETVETTAPVEDIPETTAVAEVTAPETEAVTAEPTEEPLLTETEAAVEETVSVTETEEAVGDLLVDGTDDSYAKPTLLKSGKMLSGSVSNDLYYVNGNMVIDKVDWFYFELDTRSTVTIQVSSVDDVAFKLWDKYDANIASGTYMKKTLTSGRYIISVETGKSSGTTYYSISLDYCTHSRVSTTTIDPTCDSDGYIMYTCGLCGLYWSETLLGGHVTGSWTVTKEPTCVEEGVESAKCGRCNETVTRSIEKLPHANVVSEVIEAPTCTQKGSGIVTCTACGLTQQDELPTIPHVLKTEKILVKPPSYDKEGTYSGHCSVCGELTTESIPAHGDKDAKTYVVEDGVTAIGEDAFSSGSSYRNVTIPGSVKSIGANAFKGNISLNTVTIAEGVTTIGENAFHSCGELTNFNLPDTVTSIGKYAFYDCDKLTGITIPGSLTEIGYGTFAGCDALASITIMDGISGIGEYAFNYCKGLENITIPDTVTSIGARAFAGCNNLLSITLPSGITKIDCGTFDGCSKLASVTIQNGVERICDDAFLNCYSLASIAFPESVTFIESGAFYGCTGIQKVYFTGDAPETDVDGTPFWIGGGTLTADAYYPAGNTTWTEDARSKLGKWADFTWIGCHTRYENATCTTAKTCTGCGMTVGVPLGHRFGDYTTNGDATCTQDGTKTARCDRCRETETVTDVGSALGHVTVTLSGGEPTCTDTGLTEGKKCTRCEEILVVQEIIPELGHDEIIDDYVEPTCMETGLTEGKHCGRCNQVLIAQEVIPELGHVEVTDAAVEPDCTNMGYTEGAHCDRCAFVFVAQEVIPELGHVEVIDAYLAPTCTEDGVTEGKHCDRCGEILIAQEVLPANGHDYDVGICLTCGHELPSEYQLFAGKSLNIKITNPATGKPYTAKQLTWTLDEQFEPFATMKNGKLTAKKVVERARIEIVGTVVATEEVIRYFVDIYPAVTQLEVKQDENVVNGKTVRMDFSEETLTLNADIFPADVIGTVTWTVSDAKKQQYASYEIDGNTLTVLNPTGKAGTVTVKAMVNAGVKKTVTVKISFGSFAKTVVIDEPEKTTLRGGESLQLFGYISKPDAVTKPGVVWSTSNKNAATVSNGKVTAKNVTHPTEVTITATSKDGCASDSVKIEIIPKDEDKLVLMEGSRFVTNGTLVLNYGETCQLTAAVITNGEPVAQSAIWTTTKGTVAHVADGLVTATGVGAAKITAEVNGQKAVINVKVGTLVESMEITTKDGKNIIEENNEKLVLLSSGKSVNLIANVNAGANKAVTWEIAEGAAYAKVSNGKVSANKDLTKPVYITVKATAKDGSGTNATIRVKIVPLATGVQIFQNGTKVRSNTVFVYDMLQGNTLKLSAKVYPAKANQAVQLTSSSKKIADFNENGELVCFKTGTVTITAKALDGSNAKTTFKLTIVKKVQSLTLKEGSVLTVTGGKSLKLATVVEINPSDATNKKLNWKVAPNDYGITISSSGVLKTKKVAQPVTVNIMVTAQDGSGKMSSFDVTVYPA